MAKSLYKGDCHEPTALAMTIYLFLNFDGIISANNSAVAQKHS